MLRLYVIPGSHACRSAMLMLDRKGLAYETVDLVPTLHPIAVRLHGFPGGGERRSAAGRRTLALRAGDLLGTVPALDAGGHKVSTNRRIARFLDERHPEPPLLPADPARRPAVEEAERWADGPLQMLARRVLLGAALRDPAGFARDTADGRMGVLLFHRPRARRLLPPVLARLAFATTPGSDDEVLAELGAALDRIDAWIGDGVLGGEEPNAADLMVAPSLALVLYRRDVRPLFAGRPALALVDRLLPEPA